MEAESTVYVVDDDLALRESLRDLLHSANLRAEIFADAQAFLDAYDTEKPACLLLDIRMPGIDGWDVQQTLVARKVTLPIIFITGHGDVPLAVRALKNGAFDFIEKPFRFQTLLPRIHEATAQDIKLRQQSARLAEGRTKLGYLTAREREVLGLLARGFSLKQVAHQLSRSYKTVDHHKTNLMRKLDVHDRVDLTRLAIRSGLVEP